MNLVRTLYLTHTDTRLKLCCYSCQLDLIAVWPLSGPLGDVFLLQTRDRKNPLIYTVFTTSRSDFIKGLAHHKKLHYCISLLILMLLQTCLTFFVEHKSKYLAKNIYILFIFSESNWIFHELNLHVKKAIHHNYSNDLLFVPQNKVSHKNNGMMTELSSFFMICAFKLFFI